MLRKIIFIFTGLLVFSQSIVGQQVIEFPQGLRLTFPGAANLLDTLGQEVYDYSDDRGYYACIQKKNAVPIDRLAGLDRLKFFQSIFETLQDPGHQCKMVNQSSGYLGDLPYADFYSTCKPNPDFPDLRYKRLLLIGPDLFIIDYWAYQHLSATARQNRDAFFATIKLNSVTGSIAEQPFIPSAVNHPASAKIEWSSYYWIFGLVAALILILIFLRKNPKK